MMNFMQALIVFAPQFHCSGVLPIEYKPSKTFQLPSP
ncbi:hypothetical protein J2Y83_002754 [Pseudomonas marginalis]|nr:hypothetical protein [Pseudomonas marginalis]MCP1524285.1 hypothetical protein [Pseudomonas marginalis]MDQ0499698.1 hypothetical protein [Pseudomonas marginalis]